MRGLKTFSHSYLAMAVKEAEKLATGAELGGLLTFDHLTCYFDEVPLMLASWMEGLSGLKKFCSIPTFLSSTVSVYRLILSCSSSGRIELVCCR